MASNIQTRPPPNSYHPQHHQHHSHHQSTPSTFLPNGSPMNVHPNLPQQAQIHPIPGPHPGAAGLPPQTTLIEKQGSRILCIADLRGNLRSLNDLAKRTNADHIIHTGDFGFYDSGSLDRIADKTLKHVSIYSPLLTDAQKKFITAPNPQNLTMKRRLEQNPNIEPFQLSDLPMLLEGKYTLDVPVYTVWGACEDVRVLEKFCSGEYKVDKLHIIYEGSSRLLDVGGVKLRLLGLGGAFVMHKLFDNGEGKTMIAGGQGTMWTTVLQMGELIDTANRVYDPTETRVFVTHASPARDGLLNQLSVTLKADFTISAGLHFRYGSSYNEFSVNPNLDNYRGKLAASKASFNDVWETVKGEVQQAVAQSQIQQTYLDNTLMFVEKMPSTATGAGPFGGPPTATGQGHIDESAFKNMWNFNLADAAFGWLVLDIEGGKIGTEMRAQGFNFAHRTAKAQNATAANAQQQQQQPQPQHSQQQQQTTSTTPVSNAQPGPATPVNTANTPVSPAVPPYSQAESMGKPPQLQQSQQAAQNQGQHQPSPQPPPSEPVQPALPPPPAPVEAPLPAPTPSETQSVEQKSVGSPTLTPTSPNARPHDNYREKNKRGLWVIHAGNTADEVKSQFPPEDSAKIIEVVERYNKGGLLYWYVFFETQEIKKDVLARLPESIKTGSEKGKPTISEINLDPPMNRYGGSMRDGPRPGMSDSKWSRGGDPASISRGGPGQARPGGPGGSASDGERGGRGNFRGGRGDSRSRGNRSVRGRGMGRGEDGQGPRPEAA